MNTRTLRIAVTVALCLSIVAATGAFPTQLAGTDERAVTLAPSDGPNGEYATVGDDGKLRLDFSSADGGFGRRSVVTVHDVFVVTNDGPTPVDVRIEDGADAVTFYRGSDTTDSVESARRLDAGRSLAVGVRLDLGDASSADSVRDVDGIAVHVERVATPTPGTPTETPTGYPATDDGSSGGGGAPPSGGGPPAGGGSVPPSTTERTATPTKTVTTPTGTTTSRPTGTTEPTATPTRTATPEPPARPTDMPTETPTTVSPTTDDDRPTDRPDGRQPTPTPSESPEDPDDGPSVLFALMLALFGLLAVGVVVMVGYVWFRL